MPANVFILCFYSHINYDQKYARLFIAPDTRHLEATQIHLRLSNGSRVGKVNAIPVRTNTYCA